MKVSLSEIDPLGQPTLTRTYRPFVRQSTFQNLAKQNKVKKMFATGETVGLAEWIIGDTCRKLHFDFVLLLL